MELHIQDGIAINRKGRLSAGAGRKETERGARAASILQDDGGVARRGGVQELTESRLVCSGRSSLHGDRGIARRRSAIESDDSGDAAQHRASAFKGNGRMVCRRLVVEIDLRPGVAGCVGAALRDKNGITRSGVVGKKSVAGEGVQRSEERRVGK